MTTIRNLMDLQTVGTSEGALKGWDTRGRGQKAESKSWDPRAVNGHILYHGTSAPTFNKFRPGLAYFTNDPGEAKAYADNPIIGGGRGQGQPRVHTVRIAQLEKSKDISREVNEAVVNDDDVDEVIAREAATAKQEGYRHLGFIHPGTHQDEIPVTVSMFPDEDVKMFKTPYPLRSLK